MARRDYDENRLPLGDITKSRNQDSGSKKKEQEFLKMVSATALVV